MEAKHGTRDSNFIFGLFSCGNRVFRPDPIDINTGTDYNHDGSYDSRPNRIGHGQVEII